jgi:hypothetical protein
MNKQIDLTFLFLFSFGHWFLLGGSGAQAISGARAISIFIGGRHLMPPSTSGILSLEVATMLMGH